VSALPEPAKPDLVSCKWKGALHNAELPAPKPRKWFDFQRSFLYSSDLKPAWMMEMENFSPPSSISRSGSKSYSILRSRYHWPFVAIGHIWGRFNYCTYIIYIYVYTWRFPKMVIPLNHPCWSSGWWKDRQGSTGLEPGNDKRLVVFIDAPWHTCFQHIWNAKPGQAPIFFLEWGGKCGKYFPIGFLPKWGILQN
jgi:hypothetical protein